MHQRVQWLADQLVPRAVGTVAVEAWLVRHHILLRVVQVVPMPILLITVEAVVIVGEAEEAVVEEVVATEGAVAVAAVQVVVVAEYCTIAEL